MEPGVYVTFLAGGERFEDELPPIGPLEHVVLKEHGMLADRPSAPADFDGDAGRLEAELELAHALGGGSSSERRPFMRFVAPDGLYVRFAAVGEGIEPEPPPELGPFAVVVVGPDIAEADGRVIAYRGGTKRLIWELTPVTDAAGTVRPDIALRSGRTGYHAGVRKAPAREARTAGSHVKATAAKTHSAKPAAHHGKGALVRPQPSKAEEKSGSRKHAVGPRHGDRKTAQGPSERAARSEARPAAASLAERIGTPEKPAETPAPTKRSRVTAVVDLVWRVRVVILALLVVATAATGVVSIRRAIDPGSLGSVSTVELGQQVRGPEWEYSVTNVRRMPNAGTARARGVYMVVQVVGTNRGAATAQLSPSDFSLIGDNGTEYAALAVSDPAYVSSNNTASPLAWTQSYPVGKAVATPVIFDVDPVIAVAQLAIRQVPGTRIVLR